MPAFAARHREKIGNGGGVVGAIRLEARKTTDLDRVRRNLHLSFIKPPLIILIELVTYYFLVSFFLSFGKCHYLCTAPGGNVI